MNGNKLNLDFSPLVIGGVGGSGTRVLSKLAQDMNVHMGQSFNKALDNLWFSLFFNQPKWAAAAPEHEVRQSLDLFARATLEGFKGNASPESEALIDMCLSTSRLAIRAPELGEATKRDILHSSGIEFSAYKQWGWKEPNSHIFIPQIAAFFPKARFILMVRNGLDMAFSHNQHQVKLWGRRFGVQLENPAKVSPSQSLQYWLAANALARRHLEELMPGRWLEVRYENLLADPVAEIERIGAFIGTNLDPELSQELAKLVEPPATVGRFRAKGLDAFHPNQIEAVKALGFVVE
jgi:hypothetical protein